MRRFTIHGIPRSGTSLASKLVSERVPDAFVVNEVDLLRDLPELLGTTACRLHMGLEVKNRWAEDGTLASDTVRGGPVPPSMGRPRGTYSVDPVVGIKANNILPIERALNWGWRVLCLVRDPVFAIASWNEAGATPWRRVTDDDLDPWWQGHRPAWKTEGRLTRQAELWEMLAGEILEAQDKHGGPSRAPRADQQVLLWRYEDLIADPNGFLRAFSAWWGLGQPEPVAGLENRNRVERFASDLEDIGRVVRLFCPSARRLGYGGEQ
uniref:Putative sulfotransferase domain contining protein n=1 Tax=viral metagenome TaxID=1070528 RepID=A0A6M3M5D9_9ZZZZ